MARGYMAEQLRKTAKPACSTKVSLEVVKEVSRADVIALNKSMEPITAQNAKERLASELAGRDTVWGGFHG